MNTSRRLQDIRSEFERGVFLAVYNSRAQRTRRVVARLLLGLKHGIRGLLFSWPLYLLPAAVVSLQADLLPFIFLLLLPGVAVSALILRRGVKEDYQSMVDGRILQDGFLSQLAFGHKQES